MSDATPLQTAFFVGEISPDCWGRHDDDRYAAALARGLNAIPRLQGPATRRMGSAFTKDIPVPGLQAFAVRLIDYVFNKTQAYVIDLVATASERTMGFVTDRQPVGVRQAHPWSMADLPTLRREQYGDTMWLATRGVRPHLLQRTGYDSFTLSPWPLSGGPWGEAVPGLTATVTATAVPGEVTVALSQPLFYTDDVLRLRAPLTGTRWVGKEVVTANVYRLHDGQLFVSATDGTCGDDPPVKRTAGHWDGGVLWLYVHSGWGSLTVKTKQSDTQALCIVTAGAVPVSGPLVTGTPVQIEAVQRCAWNASDGWPDFMYRKDQRLFAVRGQTVWGSAIGDLKNYERLTAAGVVAADLGFEVVLDIASGAQIQWLAESGQVLVAGCEDGERAFRNSTGAAWHPVNGGVVLDSSFGTEPLPPLRVADRLVLLETGGRKVRAMTYSDERRAFRGIDIAEWAEHLTDKGLTRWGWMKSPDNLIWAIDSDGQLMTALGDSERDFAGWTPHRLAGDGVVLDLVVIPAPEGRFQEVYLAVQRDLPLGGVGVRLERIGALWRLSDGLARCVYADSAVVRTGAPVRVVTGLDHLNGNRVVILADGAVHPPREVVNSRIDLEYDASVIVVGLPYLTRLEGLPMEAGGQDGSVLGKSKVIDRLYVRVRNSASFRVGSATAGRPMDVVSHRDSEAPTNEAPPLFTGVRAVTIDGGWTEDDRWAIEVDDPTPFTLLSLSADLHVGNL